MEEERKLKLVLPTHMKRGKTARSKTIPVSMNWWRNAHFNEITNVKNAYKKLIEAQIGNEWKLAFRHPYIEYHLYTGTKHKQDLRNFTDMADKFACDALVELFVLPEDHVGIITETHDKYMGYDKDNGRVEIFITNKERADDNS